MAAKVLDRLFCHQSPKLANRSEIRSIFSYYLLLILSKLILFQIFLQVEKVSVIVLMSNVSHYAYIVADLISITNLLTVMAVRPVQQLQQDLPRPSDFHAFPHENMKKSKFPFHIPQMKISVFHRTITRQRNLAHTEMPSMQCITPVITAKNTHLVICFEITIVVITRTKSHF